MIGEKRNGKSADSNKKQQNNEKAFAKSKKHDIIVLI